MYGWAKVGELRGPRAAPRTRITLGVVVATSRCSARGRAEDHAVIAMIARAFVRQDPFEVWGIGNQIRSWTYIDDIVEGTPSSRRSA